MTTNIYKQLSKEDQVRLASEMVLMDAIERGASKEDLMMYMSSNDFESAVNQYLLSMNQINLDEEVTEVTSEEKTTNEVEEETVIDEEKTMDTNKFYELSELESIDCGLTMQELSQKKVVIKRELRKLGFIIPNTFIDLGTLEGVLELHSMTDKDYLTTVKY